MSVATSATSCLDRRASRPLTFGILSTYPPDAVRAGHVQRRARRRAVGDRCATSASCGSATEHACGDPTVVGELVNGSPASVAAAADLLNAVRRRRRAARVRPVRRRRRRRGARRPRSPPGPVDRDRPHGPLRSDTAPAFGARGRRGARRPGRRHVRRRPAIGCASASTSTRRRSTPSRTAPPSPPAAADRRAAAADPADLGPGRPGQGDRAGDRRHAAACTTCRPRPRYLVAGQHAPEGARRRRRGLPQRPHRAGMAQRRRRLGRLRRGLPRRAVADRADPVVRGRRPALRLARTGHLGRPRRRHRRRPAGRRHRLPPRGRAARQRSRDRRRPRRPRCAGRRPAADSSPNPASPRAWPRRLPGSRRAWAGPSWRPPTSTWPIASSPSDRRSYDHGPGTALRPPAPDDRPAGHVRARQARRAAGPSTATAPTTWPGSSWSRHASRRPSPEVRGLAERRACGSCADAQGLDGDYRNRMDQRGRWEDRAGARGLLGAQHLGARHRRGAGRRRLDAPGGDG